MRSTTSEPTATERTVSDIPFGRPWITEDDRRAVAEVLESPILAHGPHSRDFEAEFAAFLGRGAHAVTVSSCMAALHLAYLQLGIGPGDEVIVPAQTHVATAHAVEWVGAHPVFADCDPATGNVTPETIRELLTPQTRAISVVHFLGIPCRMREIVELAQMHALKVVEDCALAVGARYDGTHVGLFGDAGCFSFYPVKHLTTAEGGMFVSRHGELADAVRKLRAFGVDRSHAERRVPGMYDVPSLGLNYRMSEIQAALGRSQLRRLDQNLERRRVNFEAVSGVVAGFAPQVRVLDGPGNSHFCLSFVLAGDVAARRDQVVSRLKEAGIGTSLYYPHPVPRMRFYAEKYGYDAARMSQAAAISDASIALPVGPHLEQADVAYIRSALVRELDEIAT